MFLLTMAMGAKGLETGFKRLLYIGSKPIGLINFANVYYLNCKSLSNLSTLLIVF